MALELVYTSAERGLRAGTSGFCTVAMTRGLPPALVPRLEALGGYRPGPSGDGPRAHCFWRVETAGSVAHVLAVVGPAPPDHTQRTNKLAAYLVLGQDELVPAGPAWLLAQRGLVRGGWSGAPAWIEAPVRVPASGPAVPQRCAAWEAAAGDPGWAGVVASAFLRDQSKPIHVVWRDGMDPLALVGEVLSLMPDWARWRATFSTYFLQPVAGTPCALRFCLDGTPAADAARQSKGMLIDLARPLGSAADSRFSRMARTGIDEEAVAREAERARRAAQRREEAARAGAGAAAARQEREIGLEPAEELPQLPDARRARPLAEDEAVVEEADDGESRHAVHAHLVVRGIVAVLLLLALGVSAYAVMKWRAEVDAAADAVTGGPAPVPSPGIPEEPRVAEPAPPAEAPQAPQPEATPAPQPAPEPAPEPAPTIEPAPDPVAEPAPEPIAVSQPQPAAPLESPDPSRAPARPLPSGIVGARWSLRRDATKGGAGAQLRWSGDVTVAGATQVAFRVPEGLMAVGVSPDGQNLTVAGSTFRANASLDGKSLVVAVDKRDAMPAAVSDVLGQERGSTTTEAWAALMGAVTMDVLDPAGNVLGQAQCRIDTRRDALVADAAPLLFPDFTDLPLIVQVVGDPGAPSERRVVSQSFLDPGASCTLDATALVRVSVVRGAQVGRIGLRAEALPADRRNARSAAIAGELSALDALVDQMRSLRAPVTGIEPDSQQVAALEAAWSVLSPEERARISPQAPDAPPRTAATMKSVHELVEPRQKARRATLLREIAELRTKPGEPLSMFVRVSTPEGAILAERPLRLGGKP